MVCAPTLRFHFQVQGRPLSRLFLCYEFTNHTITAIGIKAISLLKKLATKWKWVNHEESGRRHFRRDFCLRLKKHAEANVRNFRISLIDGNLLWLAGTFGYFEFFGWISEDRNLLIWACCQKLKFHVKWSMSFGQEIASGIIKIGVIHDTRLQKIKLHGHCHQKHFLLNWTKSYFLCPENYSKINPVDARNGGEFWLWVEHISKFHTKQVGEIGALLQYEKPIMIRLSLLPGTL